ncbi:hypothetical protein O0J71_05950 [Stenotrophomonas sp. Sm3119]|uniref:hypothetical protein n=1 Tax=Stenotrophomonas sp. Sm3119 TaxID=3002744 RepID=UPI0027E5007B|nr:hypothetical protein [Stenotrophomonas sp. Sm3119]MDQ7306473.1 hypothetical protein [Stenotrophomonas sp. Sm3119]
MSNPNEPPTPRKSQGRSSRSSDAPYCAFKDDRARLHALISRDIRFVLIAAVFAISSYLGATRLPVGAWLTGLLA